MTYAYCREPFSELDNLAITSVYEWADHHGLQIDVLFLEKKDNSKKSYDDRELGLKVLPLLQEGDYLIISEISCVGRSLNELEYLINNVFYNKKIKFACISMGVYIDYSFLTPEEEIILNNISFAARLHNKIVKEITTYALRFKAINGVKLGGSSLKWRQTRNKKSETQKSEEYKKRGYIKNLNHLRSKETYLFLKALRFVFLEAAVNDDINTWRWESINTQKNNYIPLISLLEKLYNVDSSLFIKIMPKSPKSQKYLSSKIGHTRSSIRKAAETMGVVSFNSLYDDNTVKTFSLKEDLIKILDINNKFIKNKSKSKKTESKDYKVSGIIISSDSYSEFKRKK